MKVSKRLKVTQQKNRRLSSKVTSLNAIVKELKENSLISTNCAEFLEKNFTVIPLELLKRTFKNGKGIPYSPKLKAFALTLQFYSTKAYEFVRKSFQLNLPHQTRIRQWYSVVKADPGFTEPTFRALKLKKLSPWEIRFYVASCWMKWQ